jgi:hypothetical protein
MRPLLAVLNDAEPLLFARTGRAELAVLDEDAAVELEARLRRARNKYVSEYRRGASVAVIEHAGRGKVRPENTRATMKAEAFEDALSRVSRRVAVLARQSAAQPPAERLAAARAAKQRHRPAVREAAPATGMTGPTLTGEPISDRALRSPANQTRRASTRAQGTPAGETRQPMSTGGQDVSLDLMHLPPGAGSDAGWAVIARERDCRLAGSTTPG